MNNPYLIFIFTSATFSALSCHGAGEPSPAEIADTFFRNSPEQTLWITPDTSVFAAVIEAIERLPDQTLIVDPRPLQNNPLIVEPQLHDLADATQIQSPRAELLARRRIRTTDSLEDRKCIEVDAAPNLTPHQRGCPASGLFKSVIIGLPRPGGAYYPPIVDELEAGEQQGHVSIRVVEVNVSPNHSAGTAYDYVMSKGSAQAWKIVKKVPIHAIG